MLRWVCFREEREGRAREGGVVEKEREKGRVKVRRLMRWGGCIGKQQF